MSEPTKTESLDFATVDHDRAARCGSPEVIFAEGKTTEQVVSIARSLFDRHGLVLVTRAKDEQVTALEQAFADQTVRLASRRTTVLIGEPAKCRGATIAIVTAGTSDEPVAEEAELTCAAMGQAAVRINDVGVAGVHRLTARMEELRRAGVIICIAGMEGALPSVVGGLVDVPVIAVPTSVGYGAAFEGIAALLGMMTSCAAGVVVVNIDNGFGAAHAACLMARKMRSDE